MMFQATRWKKRLKIKNTKETVRYTEVSFLIIQASPD